VQVKSRDWTVSPGQIAWIPNDQDNAHWPATGSSWEMLWIRVDGPHMDRLYKILTTVGSPVFTGINVKKAASIFQRVFRVLRERSIAMEATLHAEVAGLLALLFEARHAANPTADSFEIPSSLLKPLETMRMHFDQPLSVPDLAAQAGMSISRFHRQFKAATGTSPIDWLKRERINQAKKRLLETDDSIAAIADQIGYYDQFYFSRDFKRMAGLNPTEYRQRERLQKKFARPA
jgi:AraC-like DNA-binding protein